jgi:hypothetical protein
VQGQASEVAFLLKADTEFHVEFVLRDHTFDTTSVVALRCSKRTLLPAVGRVVTDSRLFYHRCVLSKPPRKHLPLGALACRAFNGWLTGGAGRGGASDDGGGDGDEEDVVSEDDVDEDALDEAALAERHAGKERRRAQRKALRKRDARHTKREGRPAKPASPDGGGGGGGGDDADAGERAGAEGGGAEEAMREEEDHDSGAEEEKEAEEEAERAAMSAVTDFYALVKKWHEHGLDVSFPPTHTHTSALAEDFFLKYGLVQS